jgi:hypothetical protein
VLGLSWLHYDRPFSCFAQEIHVFGVEFTLILKNLNSDSKSVPG